METATTGPDANLTTAHRRSGFGAPLPRWVRIFVASMTLVMAAAGGITHDLLTVWETQTRLEFGAAHMAAAGVEFLPGAPARAALAAAHSAALCGLSPSEVVCADAASDRMSFNVTVQRTAAVLFSRLLGVTGVDVTAQATARVLRSSAPRNVGGPTIVSSRPIMRKLL
jgi:hypothetical protein